MRNKIFLLLGIFALFIIPSSVYADTTGEYNMNKYKAVMTNIEDDSDSYLSQEYNSNWLTNTSNNFYNYYQASFASVVQVTQNNTTKYYTPSAVRFYNSSDITPCGAQCDLTLTFQYGFSALAYTSSTNDYNLATTLLGVSNTTTTDVGGITIHGIDIDNNEKIFKCNAIFTITNIGQNNPFYKYIGSCPTSNYKRIDYIEFQTGWQNVPNTNYINVYNSITKVSYNIGTYTGTQDGEGTFIPQPDETNVQLDEIINMDIDSSDKVPPNTDAYSSYQTAENNLFGKMNNADITDMEIAIDTNSSTWVWDRITSWLATNPLLSSFLISMLSIGIIKMALGR